MQINYDLFEGQFQWCSDRSFFIFYDVVKLLFSDWCQNAHTEFGYVAVSVVLIKILKLLIYFYKNGCENYLWNKHIDFPHSGFHECLVLLSIKQIILHKIVSLFQKILSVKFMKNISIFVLSYLFDWTRFRRGKIWKIFELLPEILTIGRVHEITNGLFRHWNVRLVTELFLSFAIVIRLNPHLNCANRNENFLYGKYFAHSHATRCSNRPTNPTRIPLSFAVCQFSQLFSGRIWRTRWCCSCFPFEWNEVHSPERIWNFKIY